MIYADFLDDGDVKLKKDLFPKNKIQFKRLRSKKGASVVFALVGFMFAAMISFVVINAAYSAASRVKKLKYDEQSFLLAQSMTGIITNALAGDGSAAALPDETKLKTPEGQELKYDALTLVYQYIEQKETVHSGGTDTIIINSFYNSDENGKVFVKNNDVGTGKNTFYDVVKGKASLTNAETAVQNMIRDMARAIDRGAETVSETLTTTDYTNPQTGEKYNVKTIFTMDKSYSINAVTTATVISPSGGKDLSKYIVRMDASAAVRTDKLICVGIRASDSGSITVNDFKDYSADGNEELVKISCYSVTWPVDQMRSVYIAP